MTDNKLVETLSDAATITSLAAGFGWIAKKVIKESMTSDPSSSLMNYVKFTVVVAASIASKQYLEDQNIIPMWKKDRWFYDWCFEICDNLRFC